jgi:hypothetical protein
MPVGTFLTLLTALFQLGATIQIDLHKYFLLSSPAEGAPSPGYEPLPNRLFH